MSSSRSELAARIPGATLRRVEGVAHGLFWQWPERTLEIVQSWLRDALIDPGAAIHDGLRRGGVDLVVYLPESVLAAAIDRIEGDPAITTLVCSREDEGVAIAAGAALTGRMAALLMEGSGLGLSGLILARAAHPPRAAARDREPQSGPR